MATKSGEVKFKDWNLVCLGESATFLRKLSLSRDQMTPGGEVSYLHYGDIHVGPRYRLNAKTEAMPTIKSSDQGNATLLRVGDLVFVDASEDKVGIGKSVEITDVPEGGLVAGLHTIAVRFDKSILADGFKAYLQEIPAFRSHLLRLAAGTKVLASTKSHIATAELLLPSIEEQEVIAGVLSTTDSLIDSLDSLIAKKQNIKQGAMQQLLTGKTRLPGFSGEWINRKLGDLASLYQSPTVAADKFSESGYPVFGANGLTGYFTSFNHESWQTLIACRGSCGQVNRSAPFSWINGNAMVVNVDGRRDIDKEFFYHLMKSQDFSGSITGSGIPQIVRGTLSPHQVYFSPDVREQRAISKVLSDMDAETDALVACRDKTALIKTGMMQELLTGRTRLL